MSFTCEKSDFERESNKENVETEVAYLKRESSFKGFCFKKSNWGKKNHFILNAIVQEK